MSEQQVYVGIDIAKSSFDVAQCVDRSTQLAKGCWSFSNDDEGIGGAVAFLKEMVPTLVVMEATGGYEAALADALAVEGLAVAVVNPRQVRNYARAMGKLAKTDEVDAKVIAYFAASVQPEARGLPDTQEKELAAVMARRRQLSQMLTMEKNRRKIASAKIRKSIASHITWLEQELRSVDSELKQLIKSSPVWQAKIDVLRSVPGVGPVLSVSLLADVRELGTLNRREVAALVGVAPLNRDSGQYRGKRSVWGGRAKVRSALYMGTLAAIRSNHVIKAFYERLCDAGKARKVAITACMRKLITILNAMVKNGEPWRYTKPQVDAGKEPMLVCS